ncbi:hypothetical protein C7C46_13075 [Streptomyces tateyamensis]|uniref:Thiopeptide-type bacteriocin biosynthesis domain-containing protein n=1 Tax=Streptomyces tateyamensis TaxID=565073 RepID=A0A2V4N762_9ACTN|nr:lantibiotic dehydratase C-terminal domain-containing protein [Streptomyces tateyamensis]AXG25744.1 lantibiotic biosynthesis protein [Streptomyces tateyamensis]PYC80216.1 hypothetical protein C7C46_13075 [Streptomyces tateyamensis]
MTATEPLWLSAHVFHHGTTDQLITEAVLPLVEELRADGLVRRAFFLRHWERGPHLRVRLQVEPQHAAALRALVEQRLTGYLAAHPGPTDADPEQLGVTLRHLGRLEHGGDADPELYRPEPPNTVRWIDYRPELAKYGGASGVAVAEDVFDAGSTLAGQVLRQGVNDNARLGVALQLLLLTSRSLDLDEAATAVFLRSYRERWQGYLPDAAKMFAAWERQYQHQRAQYAALVEDLRAGRPIGRGVGAYWERTMAAAVARLRPLVAAGQVWPGEVDRTAPPFVAVAALLCQFLHTTNNRMNVRPQGECFVAFLAHRAVTDSVSRPREPADAARKD